MDGGKAVKPTGIAIGALFLIWGLLTPPAHADISGKDLLDNCRNAETYEAMRGKVDVVTSATAIACIHYLHGFIAGQKSDLILSTVSPICMPPEVTMSQTAMVVRQGLAAKPELLHHAAGSLVQSTLMAAFPCKK